MSIRAVWLLILVLQNVGFRKWESSTKAETIRSNPNIFPDPHLDVEDAKAVKLAKICIQRHLLLISSQMIKHILENISFLSDSIVWMLFFGNYQAPHTGTVHIHTKDNPNWHSQSKNNTSPSSRSKFLNCGILGSDQQRRKQREE